MMRVQLTIDEAAVAVAMLHYAAEKYEEASRNGAPGQKHYYETRARIARHVADKIEHNHEWVTE